MHFYWRIMGELGYLGEILIIHDPSLLREFNCWVRKHSITLSHIKKESGKPSNIQSVKHVSLN